LAFGAVGLTLFFAPLVTILFASIFGRKPERLGAACYGIGLLLTWGGQMLIQKAPIYLFLGVDLLTAVGLGVITLRNPDKLWPGVAACAQMLVVVFSATRALDFPLSERSYLVMLNLSSLAGLAALAAGTWAARWGRRRTSAWDLAAA